MLELLLVCLQFSDVGEQRDMILNCPVSIAHGTNSKHLRVYFPILATIPDFARPEIIVDEGLPHLCKEIRPMPAGLKEPV